MLKQVSLIFVVDRLTGFYMNHRVYGEHGLMETLAWNLVNIALHYKHVLF